MLNHILTTCGLDCAECPWYQGKMPQKCLGCAEVSGKPFWGTCRTYSCASSKGVQHCGICSDFPCDQFIEMYDSNNPEGKRDAVYRAGVLAYRAKHGEEATVKLMMETGKKH